MARVTHPNVMSVYEVGEVEGQVFLAMEFVAGRSLGQWLDAESLDWETILDVFVDVGRGLVAAHVAGVVHRDFKPDNVMIGDDGRARVTDFGLARSVGETVDANPDDEAAQRPLDVPLTRTGAVMGTPRFMSPEQILGSTADAASDQFSFCIALYHALYRSWPFEGDDLQTLRQNMLAGRLKKPPRRDEMPKAVAEILRRGLAPDADNRYPQLGELVDALDEAHGGRHADVSMGLRPRIALAASMAGLFVLSVVTFEETRRGFRTPLEALHSVLHQIATHEPQRRSRLTILSPRRGLPAPPRPVEPAKTNIQARLHRASTAPAIWRCHPRSLKPQPFSRPR